MAKPFQRMSNLFRTCCSHRLLTNLFSLSHQTSQTTQWALTMIGWVTRTSTSHRQLHPITTQQSSETAISLIRWIMLKLSTQTPLNVLPKVIPFRQELLCWETNYVGWKQIQWLSICLAHTIIFRELQTFCKIPRVPQQRNIFPQLFCTVILLRVLYSNMKFILQKNRLGDYRRNAASAYAKNRELQRIVTHCNLFDASSSGVPISQSGQPKSPSRSRSNNAYLSRQPFLYYKNLQFQ